MRYGLVACIGTLAVFAAAGAVYLLSVWIFS